MPVYVNIQCSGSTWSRKVGSDMPITINVGLTVMAVQYRVRRST
jgi:hypothetical protein